MGKHSIRPAVSLAQPASPVIAASASDAPLEQLGTQRALRAAQRQAAVQQEVAAPAAAHNAGSVPAMSAASDRAAAKRTAASTPVTHAASAPAVQTVSAAAKRNAASTSAVPAPGALALELPHVNSYAEYMNENLVAAKAQVTIHVPRRFSGLFSRTRAITLALAAALLGVSTGAMAATNDGLPATVQAVPAVASESLERPLDIANTVTIRVVVDGVTRSITATEGATVGEALSAAGIGLGENDEISVSLSSAVKDGLKVRIARVTTESVTEPFTEPFDTTEEESAELAKGEKQTVSEGKDGSGVRTYKVYYKNGKELRREVASEIVTAKPVAAVVKVGTREEFDTSIPGVSNRVVTGSKSDWLTAAGIPQSDWGNADWLVQRESGWNPNAVNSSSGACGLAQALPCSKMGANWNDPVVALKWMYSYVNGRYGGFAGAVAHSRSHGWY